MKENNVWNLIPDFLLLFRSFSLFLPSAIQKLPRGSLKLIGSDSGTLEENISIKVWCYHGCYVL